MGTVRQIGRRRRTETPSTLRPTVTVALIAHDSKKEELARFMRAHSRLARGFRFLAPEDTAGSVYDQTLDIEVLAPDNLGGDLQIAASVVEGRVDAVMFFHDPLAALPCEPSIGTMLKVCDLEPIPIATNLASAEILLHHLAMIAGRHLPSAPQAEDVSDDRVLMLAGPWSGEDDPAGHR